MATDPEREKALLEYKKKLLERKEVCSLFLKLALHDGIEFIYRLYLEMWLIVHLD